MAKIVLDNLTPQKKERTSRSLKERLAASESQKSHTHVDNDLNTYLYKSKVTKSHFSFPVILDMLFGTVNIFVSLLLILAGFIVQYFKTTLQALLGEQFSLDMKEMIISAVPILVFGFVLHLYSLERAAGRNFRLYAFICFAVSICMTGLILYLIFKYSINWFGLSIFGNTEIGQKSVFFIPSVMYMVYSFFLIYYSLTMLKR
ncbi:MAG: hypothetical protein KBA07_06945 [Petrotogaceae bacterium]|jgi:magnesium-transporting ATPase (P-type)|nr:hypothetical protein [Petrotogaceae bacterium]HPX16978.1 hypothetical protein [Petrotogaceae bacterium]